MAIKPKTLVTLRQLGPEVGAYWQGLVDDEALRANEIFAYLTAVQESIVSNEVATQIDSTKELLDAMEANDGLLSESISSMTNEASAALSELEKKCEYIEGERELVVPCSYGETYPVGHSSEGVDILGQHTFPDGNGNALDLALDGFHYIDLKHVREDIAWHSLRSICVHLAFENDFSNSTGGDHTFVRIDTDSDATGVAGATFGAGKIGQCVEFVDDDPHGAFLAHNQNDYQPGGGGRPALIGAGNFTWSGWVFRSSATADVGLNCIGDWSMSGRNAFIGFKSNSDADNPNHLFLMFGDGGQLLPWEAQQQNFVSFTPTPLNTWFHLAVKRAGNHAYAYINGVQISLGYANGVEHPTHLNRVNAPETARSLIWRADMFHLHNQGYSTDNRDWSEGGDTRNLWSVAGEYQSQFYPNGMPFNETLANHGWAQGGSILSNGRWHNAPSIGGHIDWAWTSEGKIDDWALWNQALSADDIGEIYTNGLAGHGVGMLGKNEYVISDSETAVMVSLNGVQLKPIPEGETDFANGDYKFIKTGQFEGRLYLHHELETEDEVGVEAIVKTRQYGFGTDVVTSLSSVATPAALDAPDGSSPPQGALMASGEDNAGLVTAAVQAALGVADPDE